MKPMNKCKHGVILVRVFPSSSSIRTDGFMFAIMVGKRGLQPDRSGPPSEKIPATI